MCTRVTVLTLCVLVTNLSLLAHELYICQKLKTRRVLCSDLETCTWYVIVYIFVYFLTISCNHLINYMFCPFPLNVLSVFPGRTLILACIILFVQPVCFCIKKFVEKKKIACECACKYVCCRSLVTCAWECGCFYKPTYYLFFESQHYFGPEDL